jgi:hypothetical protein
MSRRWNEAAAANRASSAKTAPTAVIPAEWDGVEAAGGIWPLLLLLGVAQTVVHDGVVLVNAALHLRFAATRQKDECRRGEQRSGDAG